MANMRGRESVLFPLGVVERKPSRLIDGTQSTASSLAAAAGSGIDASLESPSLRRFWTNSLHPTEKRVRKPGEMQGLPERTCDGCEVVRFHGAGQQWYQACTDLQKGWHLAWRSVLLRCQSHLSRFCQRSVRMGRAIDRSPVNHLRSTRVNVRRGNSGHAHSVPSRVGTHPRTFSAVNQSGQTRTVFSAVTCNDFLSDLYVVSFRDGTLAAIDRPHVRAPRADQGVRVGPNLLTSIPRRESVRRPTQ